MSLSVSPRDITGTVSTTKTEEPRQEPTNEATPQAAATPEEKKDDFLSPKFAALARQEKQIRAERAKLKAERDALEAEKSTRLNGYIPKEKLKSDFLGALEEANLSYDEVAQQLLSAPQSEIDPTIRALQAKIAQLESQHSELKQKTEETQSSAYKQALDSIRHKVVGMTKGNPEYEFIDKLEQHDAVVSLIEETFKSDGYVMSEDEAAKEVEAYLEEEASKVMALEKIKKKLAPAPAQEKQPVTPQQQQPIKTLTNAVSTSPRRRFSDSERRQRAILAAQGLLKD